MAEPVDARDNDRSFEIIVFYNNRASQREPDAVVRGAFFKDTGYLKYSSVKIRNQETAKALFDYLESVNVTTKKADEVSWKYRNLSSGSIKKPSNKKATKIYGILLSPMGVLTANIEYPSGIVRDATYHSLSELTEAIQKNGYAISEYEKSKIAAIAEKQASKIISPPTKTNTTRIINKSIQSGQIPDQAKTSPDPKFVDDSKTTIRLGLRDIVSVMNVFGCVDKNHTINEYTAIVGMSNKADPRLFEKKIKVYRCIQCRRYFMYSSDFENELLPFLRRDQNYVFTRFEYNGRFFSPPAISDTSRFSKESILSKAGYNVGLNSTLSHRERMNILIFLYRAGVPEHKIISYLNSFIKFIGSSDTRDMTTANREWNEDLQAFKTWISTQKNSR